MNKSATVFVKYQSAGIVIEKFINLTVWCDSKLVFNSEEDQLDTMPLVPKRNHIYRFHGIGESLIVLGSEIQAVFWKDH